MTRITTAFRILAGLCLPAAVVLTMTAQKAPEASSSGSASPVAFLYVATTPTNSSTNQIEAFTVASDGRLTPVPGSPYAEDVTNLAVNGKYLFASTRNGIYIDQFLQEPGGGIKFSRSTNIQQYNLDNCGVSGELVTDHTGSSIYDLEQYADCANHGMQSFAIEKPSGALKNLGGTNYARYLSGQISFTGNNEFAFTTTCIPGNQSEYDAFKRLSSGALVSINANLQLPVPPASTAWCVNYDAADPENHVAITMQPGYIPEQPYTFKPAGPPQIAAFTVDGKGNLTTTNTRKTMPPTSVDTVINIDMAPSGKLLAVGGTRGLQLFHFNGAAPLTHYTGLLVNEEVQQIFWDNANHVYALGLNKLWVFTATPTSVIQAPGSPYNLGQTVSFIVQPKTAKPAALK